MTENIRPQPSTNGGSRYQNEKVRVAIIGVGNSTVDIAQVLKDTKTDVVVSYLPVGSEQATKWYVEQVLEAGCGFVNCIPFRRELLTLSTNGNGGAPAATNGAASNGKSRYQHDKVRVAIIGVGNCANSFVQGVHHYRDADPTARVPGLMHVDLGGYHDRDIEFTCAFDNCIPVFIAREDYWDKRFTEAGLPIIGDDIKSQVGATIVHRQLARLFHERGVTLKRTSQLNVGGNSARRSSTSAATWTSTTCSSASGWSPRRSPRRTP